MIIFFVSSKKVHFRFFFQRKNNQFLNESILIHQEVNVNNLKHSSLPLQKDITLISWNLNFFDKRGLLLKERIHSS